MWVVWNSFARTGQAGTSAGVSARAAVSGTHLGMAALMPARPYRSARNVLGSERDLC